MTIPTLTTARLVLRPPVLGDFAAMERLWASERSRYMGGPHDSGRAWFWFCHDVALWELYGHGALMLERQSDGACIGQVGINHGPLFPEKELGWLLFEGFEGQGYAVEAARAMRDWGFATLGLASLVSYVDRDNRSSRAVAERLGAVLDPGAERKDAEDLVYRHRPGPLARPGPEPLAPAPH